MARRSTLVAIAAIAALAFPVGASAAVPGSTPTLGSATYANPVTINWTGVDASTTAQEVWRSAGACGVIPAAGATMVPVLPAATSANDTVPGDGTYCYYVEADDVVPSAAYSGGLTVTLDTTAPTGTVAAAPLGAPNFVRAGVTLNTTSADAGSGVATTVVHHSATAGANCVDGPTGNAWDTTQVADGTYDICAVITDNAGNAFTATGTVVVDNTPATGAIAPALSGTIVGGAAVHLTMAATADANGIRNVRWQRSATGANPNVANGWPNLGNANANAPDYPVDWNSTQAAVGDGPDWLRAQITDLAGNVSYSAPIQVTVDNSDPTAPAAVTAPPAVAGSPTLSWTPAADAYGIDHYEVHRSASSGTLGGTVGAPIASTAAATFSFADTTAPDQATAYYTVRSFDHTGHFIDSAQSSVLVDSKAQSAARSLGAATPTASAPVLTWSAPPVFTVDHYDVYRDGLLLGSTTGPAPSYTDATAPEGVHDYAVLARSPSAQPGVLSSSFKVLLDRTPPTSGGAATAQLLESGSVQLAWPAAGDALSGVAGYIVRREVGGTPPTATDAGVAACSPIASACVDVSTSTGTFSYGVFAKDGAGNVALIGTVANVTIVDKIAPLAPTKLSLVKPKSKKPTTTLTYTLRWVKPTAPDLARVVVVLNLKHAPAEAADGTTIYTGLATSTKVRLRAGQTGYLALYSYDFAGNVSLKPARTAIKLAALIPLRPLNGSTVRVDAPLLTWKAKAGTSYYNVQVFLKGKRILTGWPSTAAFRIPKGKLQPGTYVWYVWPAVKGKGSSPTFGKLIGRATFTYKK